eukprot:499836_1
MKTEESNPYKNLIISMQTYKKFTNNNEQKSKNKTVDDSLQLLDEFHELLLHKNQRQEFKILSRKTGSCDVLNCNIFTHYSRDRHINYCENDTQFVTNHPKYVARCEILDKIHCFCFHSYDIGNRRRGFDQDDIKTSNNDIINTPKAIKNRMLKKYNQFQAGDKIKSNIDKYGKFIYGWEFHYEKQTPGDDDEKQTPIDDNNIIAVPRYDNLKQELTQNSICKITKENFNVEYFKAAIHFASRHRKKQFPNVTQQHLLALMIYCNFDTLSYRFSETYRDHIYINHFHFYYWGKTLKELISKFGTENRSGGIGKFYHGTSTKLTFPQIVGDGGKGVRIYCPLSTSKSYEVAINFSNHNRGLVIQFGGSLDAKYFSCDWLSDFANESECLFLQCQHALQINNVIDCTSGVEYRGILNALKTLDEILIQDFQRNEDTIRAISNTIHKITEIIEDRLSKLSKHWQPNNKLDSYEKKLSNAHFEYKKSLSINYAILEQNYPKLFRLFCLEPKQSKCQWIDVIRLDTLFPNVAEIEVKNIKLSEKLMEKIVMDLKTQNSNWKLRKVTIKINEEDSELSVGDVVSQYKKHFIQTRISGMDDTLLLEYF